MDVFCERKFIVLTYRKKCSIGNSIGGKILQFIVFKIVLAEKLLFSHIGRGASLEIQ